MTTIAVDAGALLDLAMRGARAAGAELMVRYGNVQGLDTKTSSTDPVSDADRAAERILVELITVERPDDGLLGEEGAASSRLGDVVRTARFRRNMANATLSMRG